MLVQSHEQVRGVWEGGCVMMQESRGGIELQVNLTKVDQV